MSESSGGNGCGCFSIVLGILTIWAVLAGLPTPWGTINIDLLPPAIRMEDR